MWFFFFSSYVSSCHKLTGPKKKKKKNVHNILNVCIYFIFYLRRCVISFHVCVFYDWNYLLFLYIQACNPLAEKFKLCLFSLRCSLYNLLGPILGLYLLNVIMCTMTSIFGAKMFTWMTAKCSHWTIMVYCSLYVIFLSIFKKIKTTHVFHLALIVIFYFVTH